MVAWPGPEVSPARTAPRSIASGYDRRPTRPTSRDGDEELTCGRGMHRVRPALPYAWVVPLRTRSLRCARDSEVEEERSPALERWPKQPTRLRPSRRRTHEELNAYGTSLVFAELKDPVRAQARARRARRSAGPGALLLDARRGSGRVLRADRRRVGTPPQARAGGRLSNVRDRS